MPDLLDTIHKQLRQRLDELRPLVSEYERLKGAEQALDGDNAAGAREDKPRRPRTRAVSRRGGRARASSARGEREANREKVLVIVGERPGITKAELQAAAGLSSAGVAQNLRRLADRGLVVKTPLPGGQTGYRRGGEAQPTGEPDQAAAG